MNRVYRFRATALSLNPNPEGGGLESNGVYVEVVEPYLTRAVVFQNIDDVLEAAARIVAWVNPKPPPSPYAAPPPHPLEIAPARPTVLVEPNALRMM